jgi:pSer/pThr/pTyr-binding forkhead associated (FHA) protein
LLGTEPVWAAFTGVVLGGDRLSALGAVGVVLVLTGIVMVFPHSAAVRQFSLARPEVRIGRRHRSGTPPPEIDLSGPPRDPGVSREHALLALGSDGRWVIADQGSTTGVLVDGTTVPPYVPVPLSEGTRSHIGVWTVLTLNRQHVAARRSCGVAESSR